MATTKKQRWLIRGGVVLALIVALGWWNYSRIINLVIPAKHRPEWIEYRVQRVTDDEFEQIARALQADPTYTTVDTAVRNPEVYRAVTANLAGQVPSFSRKAGLQHIERFREAGIREYRGPETCLECHRTIRVRDGKGGYAKVDLRENVQQCSLRPEQVRGFNTYGFNGRRSRILMGKIDRPAGSRVVHLDRLGDDRHRQRR
jgi:hypothetical protein